MIKLSKSIESLIKDSKSSNQYLFGYLDYKWEEIVGKTIANISSIQKIDKSTIYIKCKNPTWKNELQYQKIEILKKINKTTTKIKKIILI